VLSEELRFGAYQAVFSFLVVVAGVEEESFDI